ncbi:MAG: YceI family protein [Myxococcales bacterium]|nr:YceI family protein [Myxococcales bacterium]
MRTLTLASTLAFGLAVALPAFADTPFTGKTGPLAFAIGDAPAKSQFIFNSSAPMEKIRGTAEQVTGTLTFADAANAESGTGRIQTPVASFKTGNPVRDGHLQSEEWLNAKANPHISLAIEKIEGVRVTGNKANATVIGKFSVNGVAKDLRIPAELTYNADKNAIKVSAKFQVTLKDYNIKGKAGIVGQKVGEVIDVEATIYGVAR